MSTLSSFSQKEIIKLFKTSRLVCSSQELDIKLSPTSESGRVLVVTPKKIGNAPTRNLFRRRIKSIFHEEKLFQLNYNWIFLCKKPIINLSFQGLKDLILSCASKIEPRKPLHTSTSSV